MGNSCNQNVLAHMGGVFKIARIARSEAERQAEGPEGEQILQNRLQNFVTNSS
jgi:hypothetical protein